MEDYQRIKDLREDEDKTQQEIAELLNMHLTTYRRYETGEREPPFKFMISLSKLYDVSLDYIAGLTNDKRGKGFSKNKNEKTPNKEKYNISQSHNTNAVINIKE